jgi:heat shock protein HslJ/uncharacterized lipoprotein NlpE involved in copper resistance
LVNNFKGSRVKEKKLYNAPLILLQTRKTNQGSAGKPDNNFNAMKNITPIAGSFFILLAAGCSSEKTSTAALDPIGHGKTTVTTAPVRNPALEAMAFGTWKGKLPCADCEGIDYRLTLSKDKTFEETSVYLGKNGNPFTEKGIWNLAPDSTIMLTKASGESFFRLSGNNLTKLDQKGRPITSALAANYRLKRSNEADKTAVWEAKRKQGTDFIAMGNGSAWNLEVDSEKMIRFEVPKENLKLNTEVPTTQKLPEGKGMVYRAKTEAGTLSVRILNQPCTDKASGQEFAYSVEVTANAQSYMGCGEFLQNPQLNGNWVLERMNGKAVNAPDFPKGAPTLELQLTTKKALGYAGCNHFTGNLEIKGNALAFGALAATRMACQNPAMAFETDYLKLLSGRELTYTLESDKLLLKDKTQTVLEYKKAE